MLDYLQLYPETLELVKRYKEDQRCRLYEAMAIYAFTGEEPSWPEDAPEWFIWEALKQQVNRTAKKVSQNRANASGNSQQERNEAKPSIHKPTRVKASQQERNEAKPSETPNHDNESEYEKEIDNHGSSAGARANPFTVTDDEVADFLDRDRQIEEAARCWGLPCNDGNMIKARDLARDYTLPWLLRAIETAGNGKEQTWRYTEGILKSWKDNGGPDAPRKQRASPGKTVSAQQYGQRDYTPEELDAVSGDLLAEARAQREATA